MARNALLDTSTVNVSTLFANGKLYRVPPFQRDYSWQEEHWEDLWSDVTGTGLGSGTHYLGAIVLQASAEDQFTVIDGQQRLATISLLALAVLARIKKLVADGIEPNENQQRFDLLFSQFIGSKDPASLRASSKLTMNQTDDGFYSQTLVQFRQPITPSRLLPSELRLWSAFEYFEKRLDERFGRHPEGATLADFLASGVAKRLVFIQILVEDDLSAYTVFETLNARGIELTAADLLKNYLFSLARQSPTDLQHVQGQWQRITAIVPARDMSGFLRHFLNSTQAYVRSERLFKEIKNRVTTREEVFSFLDRLQRAAGVYAALDDPYDNFWVDFRDGQPAVRALKLYDVSQYRPLVLAWFEQYSEGRDLDKLLRMCEVISFRFNVIARRNTQELERAYNHAAIAVSNKAATRTAQVFDHLKSVYVTDEEFRQAFATEALGRRKSKLVVYVLSRLEAHLRQDPGFDADSAGATLEHILPENPSDGWSEFDADQVDANVWRAGNLTLLERAKNRQAGSKGPESKQALYLSSAFELTKRLEVSDWSPGAVRARSTQLADLAVAVWRLDFGGR